MSELEAVRRATQSKPAIFKEFFGLGLEDSSSPFLTPSARLWAANLTLKASIIATILLIISFALSWTHQYSSLASLLLVGVYFLAGIPALIESIEDLINFNINIDILMTLAAFSSVLIGSGMEGALLLVLFALSGSIEDAVTAKAKDSINALHHLTPSTVSYIEKDGQIVERSVNDVEIGSLILVKAGEIIPLDGVVEEGISSLSLAHLTGESLPIRKQSGDEVYAGSQNLEGTLQLKVVRTNADSTLARIIALVTQAQESKPKLQRWFDQLSQRYAMTIISLSAIFAIAFPWIFQIPFLGIEGSIYRALAFLIAASPCALILALPIAYLSAISACAREGILLKGGTTLDALAQCSIIAFDKTGTLTTGSLNFTGLENVGKTSSRSLNDIWAIAYALEQNVTHPIATAVVEKSKSLGILPLKCREFRSIPGYGVQGFIGNELAFMGQADYVMQQMNSEFDKAALQAKIENLQAKGEILALLSIGEEIYLFSFSDQIRPNLKPHLAALKKQKRWQLLMLTGDHEINAALIAKELDIDLYYANLKPDDKLRYVALYSESTGLAMIGDGINDAPALARATVGICMGKFGSTAAIEAADIILLEDNLERLGWLMKKAAMTQRIVNQNLTIAVAAIIIASFPALAGLVPLWLAVIIHEGGTILVGLNALRLLK